MASSVTYDSSGLDNLIRRLGRETERVAGESRQRVAEAARNRAPVKSGRLRRSIAVVGDEVQVGAAYGAEVEGRTPFLEPSVIEDERTFEQALDATVRRLGNG